MLRRIVTQNTHLCNAVAIAGLPFLLQHPINRLSPHARPLSFSFFLSTYSAQNFNKQHEVFSRRFFCSTSPLLKENLEFKPAVNKGNHIDYSEIGNSIDQFKWKNDHYIAPFDMSCPLDVIILYNPSNHANNVAVDDLKRAWPNLRIVQTVCEGRTPVVGVTSEIYVPKNSWGDMQVFKQRYHDYCVHNRYMHKMKVGFYPIWSSMAEDSTIARQVEEMGFQWVGASPCSMDGLSKIEYKQFCQQFDLPTAPFFTLSPPKGEKMNEEDAIKYMMKEYEKKVKGTPLENESCFIKSEYGGGGRGTKKSTPDISSIEMALRNVVGDTKKIDGIYAELSLDLSGASLYQLEMEVDAGSVAEGGRLVYFNHRNQKMIEFGFNDHEITRILPPDIFKGCRHATAIIARESKYNGRGTNELLIAKMPNSEWYFYCSEFNKRIQVEHKALAYLKRYHNGELFNTVADQVIRSCGYRPPDYQKDLQPSGGTAVAHIRFIAPTISHSGDVIFPVGIEVDESIVPKGFPHALLHTGKLYADTDAQFGCCLIFGKRWSQLLPRLQTFAHGTVILGKNIPPDYFYFLQKFFDDKRVADLSLPCNHTFDVLKNPASHPVRSAQIVKYLNHGVARTLVNGYRPKDGVQNRGWPTDEQLHLFEQLRDRLAMMPVCRTNPFLHFFDHLDENQYFDELRETLGHQGGGMVSVFPRDVQQECAGSESHLIALSSKLLLERTGPHCGFIGIEQGGAQYQTAEMNHLNSFKVLKYGLMANMPTYSLMRSQWLNALVKLNNEEIKYILAVISGIVRKTYNLSEDQIVPYFPYNFHAGNVPEQDEVTGFMLDAKMIPLPCFVWDPRFTMVHFKSWLARQLAVWNKHGRTLHAVRIKNPGQQKEWTTDNVYGFVESSRAFFKKAYNNEKFEPIVHIHNHNFNGSAPHVAYDLLQKCQKNGYHHLVVDVAPPLMTHNNDLVVAKALNLPKEAMDYLHFFNESAHTIWQLTNRFHDFLQVRIDPDTVWAGGTGSSDLKAAEAIGLARSDIEAAKMLGAKVSGLGGIVTPYSQWSMVIGYNCWLMGLRTYDAVKEHVEAGKLLNIPGSILKGLHDWKTLLERPPLVEKILENHRTADSNVFTAEERSNTFDENAIIEKIREKLPQLAIDDIVVARVLEFGDLAMKSLEAECDGEDNNWLLHHPEIAYCRHTHRGKVFAIHGVPVVFEGKEEIPNSAHVTVTYKYEGRYVRVTTVDFEKQKDISRMLDHEIPYADTENPCHVGAFMPGVCNSVNVKVGQKIAEGNVLYSINSMKMITAFKTPKEYVDRTVEQIYVSAGQELAFSGNGEAPLVLRLSKLDGGPNGDE